MSFNLNLVVEQSPFKMYWNDHAQLQWRLICVDYSDMWDMWYVLWIHWLVYIYRLHWCNYCNIVLHIHSYMTCFLQVTLIYFRQNHTYCSINSGLLSMIIAIEVYRGIQLTFFEHYDSDVSFCKQQIPYIVFNGCTVEVCEWISSFIPHLIEIVISSPRWDSI